MRRVLLTVAASLAIFSFGCPMPPSNAARMQEAATDFNTNVRFGRTSLAVEKVAVTERDEFLKHRKGWGKDITLADYELVSAKMIDEENAEVVVKYDWYEVANQELRVTSVSQKWHKKAGDWQLAGETRSEGDKGLFGEDGVHVAATREQQAPQSVQFPTVRFGD